MTDGGISFQDAVGAPPSSAPPLTIKGAGATPPAAHSDGGVSFDDAVTPNRTLPDGSINQGPLANTQDDSWASGALKGAATGAIKGLASIPGYVGNINDLGDYLAAKVISKVSGKSEDQARADIKAGDAAWGKINPLSPVNAPDTGVIAAPVLKQTGDYQPTSELGRLGQAGVEAATGALGPGSGAANIVKSGAEHVVPAASKIVAQTVKQAPVNAVAGAAGQGATDATGDPLWGLAASAAVPAAAEGAARTAAKVMSPALEDLPVVGGRFAGTREANVGNDIIAASANPQNTKDWASTGVLPNGESDQPLMPGPAPTTGAVLGDPGLLAKQRQMRRDDGAGMIQYDQARNAAQQDALQSLADPNADRMLPSQYLGQQADAISKATELAQQKLAQQAVQAATPLASLPNPEDLGNSLRNNLAALHDQQRTLTTQMYADADPNGIVRSDPSAISGTIKSIRDSVDPLDSDITPAEQKLYSTWETEAPKMAADTGTIPYKSLIAFDRNLNSVLPDADKGSRFRLNQLKSAVMDTLNNSLDQQHAVEQQAVAAGQMSPEDTMLARVRQQWNLDGQVQAAGQRSYAATGTSGPGAGAGGYPGTGPGASLGDAGASGQGGSGFRPPPSNPGVSQAPGGAAPYNAADAASRLAAAKQQFASTKQTYDQGPVGNALATNGYKGQFNTPASALPGQAFKAGPTGYETAKAFLAAGQNSPDTIQAMQHAALYPLKDALTPESMVSSKGLANYKQRYAGALRALDEASPGFSSSFDSAAKATDAAVQYGAQREALLGQFQRSAGAKLIGKTDPAEAQNEIWGMISDAKNGPTKLRQLMAQTKGSPDAQEGIRALARDAIAQRLSNTSESGTSGNKIVSNDKASKLVTGNMAQLREIFPKDQVDRLAMLAHQKMLDNREVTAGTIKASAADRARDISHALSDKLPGGAAHGAAAGGLGVALYEAVKDHGIEHPLLTGAAAAGAAALYGLNKLRSHGSTIQQTMFHDAVRNPLLAQKYVTRAMTADQAGAGAKVAANSIRRALISTPVVVGAAQ